MQQRYHNTIGIYVILGVLALGLLYPSTTTHAQQVCSQDLNNDGTLQQGETANCVATPQGQLCPISAATCTYQWTTAAATCPVGTTLNTVTNRCEASPSCAAGNYNPVSHQCELSQAVDCTPGSLDVASSTCLYGVGNSGCAWGGEDCPGGWGQVSCTYDDDSGSYTEMCSRSVCMVGTYNATTGMCDSASAAICPAGTALNTTTNKCEAAPTCSSGNYDNTQHLCVIPTPGTIKCPLDTATVTYQCMNNSGSLQCSPNTCSDLSSGTTPTVNPPYYPPDGPVDPNGNCLGQIYLFSGRGATCRPPGWDTQYFDCCDDTLAGDAIDPTTEALLLTNPVTVLPTLIALQLGGFMNTCTAGDAITDAGSHHRMCHYVGDFCSRTFQLGIGSVCVQETKTYCCFHGKLARIIQEQGRPQLQSFGPGGGWGTAQAPNCRGFTPDEFQNLDFSKIDLSEYMQDIKTTAVPQVQQNMQNKVQQFYNNTTNTP